MIRALVVLVALAAIVAVAAAFAPASLVADRLAREAADAVRVADASGTVWNGAATLADRDGRWSLPIRWHLEALPLLRGEARLDLLGADAAPGLRARIVARGGTIEARGVDVVLPARALPLPPEASASGDIRIVADTLRIGADRHEGSAKLEWPQARIAVGGLGPVDLGTVTATLAADGTHWRGPLRARGGVLHVDGDASIDTAGADVTLTLVPQPEAPEALRQWLGPADATGAVRLRATPRFR